MIRHVLICMTLLAATACSSVRLGYNSADELLAYRMNDWFALSDELEPVARERLDRVFAWHRREELPEYARLLQGVHARLSNPTPLTAPEVLALQQQVTRRLLRLGGQVSDEFGDIIGRLEPANEKRLLARLEDSNKKFREEFVEASPQELRKQRVRRLTDRYEFWLGKLDAAQRARIENWADNSTSDAQGRLAQRQRRQQEFLAIVEYAGTHTSTQTANRLRAFFADWETPAAPEERQRQRRMLEGWAQLTADLFNMAAPAQRARALERLQEMSEDFRTLSRP